MGSKFTEKITSLAECNEGLGFGIKDFTISSEKL